VRRAPIALLTLATFALACNGQIRFDERPLDSGAPGCASGQCGWETGDDCDGGTCGLECPSLMMCVGSCGTACTATCEQSSRCALTTGTGSRVVCKPDASCTFVIGDRSRAHCDPGTTCGVRCTGACLLESDTGASCQLQCGAGASTTVTGSTTCP
jgi:hypothetical protein